MNNFGEYQLVPLSAEEQQLVQEVSALYIFLPGFNSMLDMSQSTTLFISITLVPSVDRAATIDGGAAA